MSFDQPYLLLGLLAVPILLAAYLWQTRRRRPAAVRYSNVALVRSAAGPSHRWRRHVPVALVIASLGLLGVAAARPQVKADVPISSSTVILALDVSGSMCATDVEPNRLGAAQAAVRKFVETQGDDTKIGLVLFSGFAQLAVAPTTNKNDLLNTLDAVTTGRGTTIGAAILKSIDAIAELDPNVAAEDAGRRKRLGGDTDAGSEGRRGRQGARDRRPPHRRGEYSWDHARGRRRAGRGARGSGLSDRVRDHEPDADGLLPLPAGRDDAAAVRWPRLHQRRRDGRPQLPGRR
jgi:Ca-activated chloride channel family protein